MICTRKIHRDDENRRGFTCHGLLLLSIFARPNDYLAILTKTIDVKRDRSRADLNRLKKEVDITGGIQIDYTVANVKIMQMPFTSEWDPRDERGYN